VRFWFGVQWISDGPNVVLVGVVLVRRCVVEFYGFLVKGLECFGSGVVEFCEDVIKIKMNKNKN
jgi:hypothetical protein